MNSFTGSSKKFLISATTIWKYIYIYSVAAFHILLFTCYEVIIYLKTLSFIGKVPQGSTVKKFRKCLKTLLHGCFSHALLCYVSVMPLLVVKFYQEIFYKSHLSNVSRQLLLKSPQNNQSFLIQSKVSKHYRIYGIFSNFLCILLLPFNFLGITWESQKSWWVIFQAFTEPKIQNLFSSWHHGAASQIYWLRYKQTSRFELL